ncbi:MAG: choice-of-anchor L domain-containing protein [Sulfurimonas sp.]|nr:choice-of-anchor L domain-containing protein [Sulfurimonas sp.]
MNFFYFLFSYYKNIFFILVLITSTQANATATFTQGSTATELAEQIEGIGITITNPQITFGTNTQRGIFSNGRAGAGLEIDEGIILTTMSVNESFSTNNRTDFSVNNANNDDADLIDIDANARFNTIVFQFDVTLDDRTRLLLIDYQFASEEYPEYVGSRFNDAFGFFISGGDLPNGVVYNIARVVDNNTYVTINDIDNYPVVVVNNVNIGEVGIHDDATPEDLSNSAFFIDNNQNNDGGVSPVIIEYDGLTRTLHASLDNLTPGETYHFKMAIADSSDSALNTGVFVNKIRGLTEPSICYDYAYKQNGLFLTEGYDALKGPFISGDVSTSSPIEVAMFFMNTNEAEITADNIIVNILDINTSQATYKTESVWVTEPNTVSKIKIDDVDLNVSNSYIYDIPVASFDSFEYFYTYFSLDPLVNTLSLPIIARIDYDLIIPLSLTETITIERSSLIDTDIPICGGGSNTYDPVYGIFNIIENGLYTNQSSYFYNINTQVTNREASLSIASVDGNLTSNADLHTLTNNVSAVIGIDMLDLKSFHYTGASCGEIGNAISDRTWVIVDQDYITPLVTNDLTFYEIARENVALRISYNVNADNGDLIQLEKVTNSGNDRWNVLNFSDAVKSGECSTDMAMGSNMIAEHCTNSGADYDSAMTPEELAVCMECVYGINTKVLCARDNFSIRPEAFLIKLDDQDQNNTATQKTITNGFSGVTAPSGTQLDIAAGYKYNLEVNATNHLDNQASSGYNVHLNTISGTSSGYYWEPDVSIVAANCNDTNDSMFTTILINGEADIETSIPQVGEYSLKLLDTSWTRIDSEQQSHQTGSYFIQDTRDCVLNSSNVENVGAFDNLNGCNISSNHDSSSDTNLKYRDLDLFIHPYKFNMAGIIPSHGINNSTIFDAETFVYMTDMTNDEEMSFHLNGAISAVGYNGSTLSNFVDNCYAEPINLTVNKTVADSNISSYRYNFNNTDVPANEQNGTINGVSGTISLVTSDFIKANNGTTNTELSLNFNRDVLNVQNPEMLTYTAYDSSCTTPANCSMNADLISAKETKGTMDLNQTLITTNSITIRHYYGRSHASRQRYTGGQGTANIFYEVYCFGEIGTNDCQKTRLQQQNNSIRTDDIRWYINENHSSNEGTAGTVFERDANNVDVLGVTDGNHQDDSSLMTYNITQGYPYKTTMENNASNWLIHNEHNINADVNQFQVEFESPNTNWSGEQDTTTTTTDNNTSTITNRRSMW